MKLQEQECLFATPSPEYELSVEKDFTVTKFLALFKITDTAYFAAWDKKNFKNNRRRVLEIAKAKQELIKWSKGGTVNLGFIPNSANSNEEVVVCTSVFVEFDDGSSLESQIEKIRNNELPEPTLIVFTGNKSYHFYWCLEESISPSEFTSYQKHLSRRLGSDPAIHNPARTMRLPYSIHPATGVRGKVIHCSNKLYKISELGTPTKEHTPLPKANIEHKDNAPILKYIDQLEDTVYSYKGNSLTSRCPNHNGKSSTVFWVNLSTGKFCCHAGCNNSDILKTLYNNSSKR
jgi:hypothetical protein